MREATFTAFDTTNIIHCDVSDDAIRSCIDLCLGYHRQFDRFSSDSEVSRLNDAAGMALACSDDVRTMLGIAQSLYHETNGAYNIALGPVMDLWHFEDDLFEVPDEAMVQDALSRCDLSSVEIDGDKVRIPVGMNMDLGSIAKGYAADRAAIYLIDHGATSGFVNFGGTIVVLGPKEDGSRWRFGQQEPYADYGTKFWAVLESYEGAFATSGSYERGIMKNDVRYHHLIDAHTGFPLQNGILTASVWAANATMADALSTAIFALGAEEGLRFACELQVEALIRMESGKVLHTEDFPFRFV